MLVINTKIALSRAQTYCLCVGHITLLLHQKTILLEKKFFVCMLVWEISYRKNDNTKNPAS